MSIHYLYRINGGQVLGMSINTYEDSTYFANLTDPLEPDGRNLQPPKIHDAGTVRNATAPEVAAFATAEAEDQNLMDRETAKTLYTGQSVSRKVLKAFAQILVDYLNVLHSKQKPPLPATTLAEFVAAVKGRIDSGDCD